MIPLHINAARLANYRIIYVFILIGTVFVLYVGLSRVSLSFFACRDTHIIFNAALSLLCPASNGSKDSSNIQNRISDEKKTK